MILYFFKAQSAPVQIAVLPLSKKPALMDMGHKIQQTLQKHWFVEYDISGRGDGAPLSKKPALMDMGCVEQDLNRALT